ncbi:uncharacterized protein EI90DRAFT_3017469 [Cantharellus anzutake]|uniref:uncharacterized protein n=1 Tax=Cantharellus anzutake TaxID=1750568 RepID=UPI001907C90D|nr:uncharacterized protein EI90DRAFT_3017469 [Cantharellus anzutake]KAF8328853.1 hypothetical protein EI90DRAFT_3017469 [Cantharellus anzutake]
MIVKRHPEYMSSRQRYHKSHRHEDIKRGFRKGVTVHGHQRASQTREVGSQGSNDAPGSPVNADPKELKGPENHPESGKQERVKTGGTSEESGPHAHQSDISTGDFATQRTLVNTPHSQRRRSRPTHKFPDDRKPSQLARVPRKSSQLQQSQDSGKYATPRLYSRDDGRRISSAVSLQPQRVPLPSGSRNLSPSDEADPLADLENMPAIGSEDVDMDTGVDPSPDVNTNIEHRAPTEEMEFDSPRSNRRAGQWRHRIAAVITSQPQHITRAMSKALRAAPPEYEFTKQPVHSEEPISQVPDTGVIHPIHTSPSRPYPDARPPIVEKRSSHSWRATDIVLRGQAAPLEAISVTPSGVSDIPNHGAPSLIGGITTARLSKRSLSSIPFSARFPARVSDRFGGDGDDVYPRSLDPQIVSRLFQMQVQFGFDSHDVYDVFLKQNRDLKATMDVLETNREFLDADSSLDGDSEYRLFGGGSVMSRGTQNSSD